MLEHGGNLLQASERYGIALDDWLDLSTGINPNGWPVPTELPASLWSRLPMADDDLLAAARAYYQTETLAAVAGSQVAIQLLPQLRSKSRVGIFSPAYAEHAYAWQKAGHELLTVMAENVDSQLNDLDVLIIINPNNPTGERFSVEQLLAWHQQLVQKGGWLIVDEAFMDATPEQSLLAKAPLEGLIILRSLGKFFGLAGLRVGFVSALPSLLQQIIEASGPWPIASASRYLAEKALRDTTWQQTQITALTDASTRLAALLSSNLAQPSGGSELFQWLRINKAEQIHQQLAEQGIWTRLFSAPQSLRFGLPGNDDEFDRLQVALNRLVL